MAEHQSFEDKLAIQLMECAIAVKKGERTNPLVLDTLEKLRTFCETGGGNAGGGAERRHSSTGATTTSSGSSSTTVSKPTTVSRPLNAVLGKMIGKAGGEEIKRTPEQKSATSQKNAARVKEDLSAELQNGEHPHNQSGVSSWLPVFGGGSHAEDVPKQQSAGPQPAKARPEFQRPSNPKSALIANGWVEQQRRSRMRTVWKDVLASLVEGRKPGEETTLWIQRQITNSQGVAELEALHQIPVKWLQDVSFTESSHDNRFSLRVYNLNEDFIFRCPRDPAAAENWVMTLRSAKESAIRKKSDAAAPGRNAGHKNERHRDEKKSPDLPTRSPPEASPAPATPAGNPPTPAATPVATEPTPPPQQTPQSQQQPQQQQQHQQQTPQQHQPPPPQQHQQQTPQQQPPKKMSVKEMRALAHGAGINTVGMERGELERIALRLTAPQHAPPRPAPAKPPEPQVAPTEERGRQEEMAKSEHRRESSETKAAEDEAQKEVTEQGTERKRQEEEHQRVMAERVRAQQEALRKQKEEEERKRLAHERQMREEEEMRRRAAQQQAEEQRRQQEEAVRRQQEAYRQQQQAWQQQQAEEERRRRMAEEQQAEQRRQHEEAYRRHQQWQQQQQAPHAAPPQWRHQQQQPPFGGFPGQQQYPPPPNGFHGGQQPHSPADNKYAKMAAQQDDNKSIQHIKHAILIHWALQPPLRQGLRQIEELITSIHTVFPPAFGVPGHEHFQKWKPVSASEVDDEDKIEKKVKKLRFFLHPDKLPKDLNADQSFMCRMLWDITSDALEEHKKRKEELSWIHQ